MESKDFKKLFEENCKKLKLEKFKTSYFTESTDSLVFLILRKSGYSKKYYLRVKVELKPTEEIFKKEEYIKHDVSNILMSLDSESPEIFDLENQLSDLKRSEKIDEFFNSVVSNWIEILIDKNRIMEKFRKDELFLLPYTKKKLGIK